MRRIDVIEDEQARPAVSQLVVQVVHVWVQRRLQRDVAQCRAADAQDDKIVAHSAFANPIDLLQDLADHLRISGEQTMSRGGDGGVSLLAPDFLHDIRNERLDLRGEFGPLLFGNAVLVADDIGHDVLVVELDLRFGHVGLLSLCLQSDFDCFCGCFFEPERSGELPDTELNVGFVLAEEAAEACLAFGLGRRLRRRPPPVLDELH